MLKDCLSARSEIFGSHLASTLSFLARLPGTLSLNSCCGAQIAVKGMHCSACSSAVQSALAALPGVSSASVALLAQSAEVGAPPPLLGASCVSCIKLPLFLAWAQAR